jgi:hypothetical protein
MLDASLLVVNDQHQEVTFFNCSAMCIQQESGYNDDFCVDFMDEKDNCREVFLLSEREC